jgi:hypothetical protein
LLYPLLAGTVFPPLASAAGRQAAAHIYAAPVPAEMRSAEFTVKVNGQAVDVAHAASTYEYVSFDSRGAMEIEITAAEPGFWERGVDIQPWRLGIRPQRVGQTIRFHLNGPQKLSISRPGDFLNKAKMLFLFAGTPPPPPPSGPNVQVIPAGVYRQSLNPKSGETIYLSPGAYLFGSLNLWKVENVKVLGRGTIVYEGAQDPNSDEGWRQLPDWHCIGAMEAHNVEIDGLTCLVRARTWSIQMKDSTGFVYDDLRLIGGNSANANQDGMDWLGGGDAVVRDSFLRASDDVFALIGNWDGYNDADLLRPGHDVNHILIEHSVLSTSISNIVRTGWPRKTFNSRSFTLRDSDILHGGIGACGQTFGLIGFWGAQKAKGEHSDFTFENLFLDNWYSLVQLEQEEPSLHGFTFRNLWALDQPALASSTITGNVRDVSFENIKLGNLRATTDADLQLVVSGGAEPARFVQPAGPQADFWVDAPVLESHTSVTFTAEECKGAHYMWFFGDGTQGTGRKVRHSFPDALGTELDGLNGAGRFRVLLRVEDAEGRVDWAARGLVVVDKWQDALPPDGPEVPGLEWKVYPGSWTELPDLSKQPIAFHGDALNFNVDAHGLPKFAAVWEGMIEIPADGGYTFHLMARDGARLVIDGTEVAKTGPPFAQVCGSPGNAMRYDRGALGLRAGKHTIHLEALHTASEGQPRLLWEGPALRLTDVAPAAFSHKRGDVLTK